MRQLIIEIDVRSERFEHFGFVHPAQEESLIKIDTPGAQRADHTLMGWAVACRD